MKKLLILISICLTFVSCKSSSDDNTINPTEIIEETSTIDIEVVQPTIIPTESEVETNDTSLFSFADVVGTEFLYSSGVGAWGTVLTINEDGTFQGNYHDSEMGMIGPDYPNGTYYYCGFSGKFSKPEKAEDNVYKFSVESIEYERTPGEEIKDGIRYVYSNDAVGLEDSEYLYMYLPGDRVMDLPEAFQYLVSFYDSDINEEVLYFYSLYNPVTDNAFSSMKRYAKSSDFSLELLSTEETDFKSRYKLFHTDYLTQAELNVAAKEMYEAWDELINLEWGILKSILDENTMAVLTEEQLEWIKEKESEVEKAGKQVEGGSMQPMIEYHTAAEITKDRVYELAEYLR